MQPNFPQHPAAQPQFSAYEHAIFSEVVRAICHVIAREMHSDLLDKLAAMDDPHGILMALRAYNDQNEAKIQRREHLQKAPAAPATGTSRRRADGSVDAFNQNDATARTRAIFEQALGKRGR